MQKIQHSWFDPTTLMSRTVNWDILPSDFSQRKIILEKLKTGLIQQNNTHLFDSPKKRGRQKQNPQINHTKYNVDILNAIGIINTDNFKSHLYYIKIQTLILGLVGYHFEKNDDKYEAELDLIYILPEWRKRGLAKAVSEYAGLIISKGPSEWTDYNKNNLVLKALSTNEITATLVNQFFDSIKEYSNLTGKKLPDCSWQIT